MTSLRRNREIENLGGSSVPFVECPLAAMHGSAANWNGDEQLQLPPGDADAISPDLIFGNVINVDRQQHGASPVGEPAPTSVALEPNISSISRGFSPVSATEGDSTPPSNLTREPVHPSLQQFLSSFVRVTGHEPSADEIAEFIERNRLL